MALFAVGAELAAMNVCVAVRAVFRGVGKNEFDVALPATHRFMQSS